MKVRSPSFIYNTSIITLLINKLTLYFNSKGLITLVQSLDYQVLHPAGDIGPLDVTVKIVGYKPAVLKDLELLGVKPMQSGRSSSGNEEEAGEDSKLSHSIDLILVNDVEVDPAKHSLYNHPNNKVM